MLNSALLGSILLTRIVYLGRRHCSSENNPRRLPIPNIRRSSKHRILSHCQRLPRDLSGDDIFSFRHDKRGRLRRRIPQTEQPSSRRFSRA